MAKLYTQYLGLGLKYLENANDFLDENLSAMKT